jgi:ubiquinone/menaquinone biosynthesis C-methylase UbiE
VGHTRFLSHGQAERFYDRFGAKPDTQSFYELPVLRDLAKHLDLKTCRAVVEFGCGTGRFAVELLETSLPSQATYLGMDVSRVMVALRTGALPDTGGEPKSENPTGRPTSAARMALLTD